MRHSLFALVPVIYTGFMVADATVIYSLVQASDEDPYFYFAELDKDKKKPSLDQLNPLGSIQDEASEANAKLLDNASDTMKEALYKIPYIKEVLMGGELAKLAFDYLVA